jgi:uncharacterized Ntn-hydrolase superfamily protein
MPAGTFSIVACDRERAEWGVAVASKFLAVGALCAWAEANTGAIATQSWIKASYGPEGLGLLAGGASATEALERMLSEDEGREQRQVGIIDSGGRTASHTGTGCIGWAGSQGGPDYTAQGNMLVSADTLAALASGFESAPAGPLAARLLAALAAAQAAGGDRRGQQAAALLVASRAAGYGGADVLVDLRVDDHPQPVTELERLYDLHQLYFGSTPEEHWIETDAALETELRDRLERLGYRSGDLAADLDNWAGVENLEERVRGVERLDPVVLAELRKLDDSGGRE